MQAPVFRSNQTSGAAFAAQSSVKDTFQRQVTFGLHPHPQENDLHRATDVGNITQMNILLFLHPEYLEQRDANGCTPLLRAASHSNFRPAQVLIKHGAYLLARDYNGQNTLHYAAIGAARNGGDIRTLGYLLSYPHVEPHEADYFGFTPKEAVLSLPPQAGLHIKPVLEVLTGLGG